MAVLWILLGFICIYIILKYGRRIISSIGGMSDGVDDFWHDSGDSGSSDGGGGGGDD